MSAPRIALIGGGVPWHRPPPRLKPLLSGGVVARNLQRALGLFAGEVRPWEGDRNATSAELDGHLAGIDLLVCDAYDYSAPFLERRATTGQRWRALILAHGNMPKGGDSLFTRRAYQVRPGDGILFTSTADQAIWRRLTTSHRLVERVLPLPVDGTVFRPEPKRADLHVRSRFGLPDNALLLLYVGRYNIQKNLHGLLDLLAEARRSHPDVHLACVGEADETWLAEFRVANTGYLDYLRSRATELGVADALHLTGPAFGDDLAALYRTADVVVNLGFYHRENFGLSQAEAQACGTPVVCSAWGGFPDVVVDGVTGVLVDAVMTRHGIRVNWADAAAAVTALLDDEAHRQAMAHAAAARGRDVLSIDTFTSGLAEAVDTVLGSPAGEGAAFEPSPLARSYWRHATQHGWADPNDDGWEPAMYQGTDYETYRQLLGPYTSADAHDVAPQALAASGVPFRAAPWTLDPARRLLCSRDPVWPHRRFLTEADWAIATAINGSLTVAELADTVGRPFDEARHVIVRLYQEGFVLFHGTAQLAAPQQVARPQDSPVSPC